MDIDEYLRQKKTLEEQKKLLETQQKVHEEKSKIEKPIASSQQSSPQFSTVSNNSDNGSSRGNAATSASSGGSGVKTLMMINIVILLGVLAVFAIFYLFPPTVQDSLTANKLTGQVVANGQNNNDPEEKKEITAETENEETTNTSSEEDEENTEYIGPQFEIMITDTTEGEFDDEGKLKNSGKILSIQGPTFYNDFTIALENKEQDKILCSVDRKIDIDTNMDGELDVEGIYSLDRHTVKIKPAETEEIKAGIESVPGSVSQYQGKGEVWAEYEVRCYFCLDEKCDSYEKRGEEKRKKFFRVRINDNLIYSTTNTTNSS